MISFDEITEGSGGGSADLLPIYQSVSYLLNCCNDVQSSMSIFESGVSVLSSTVDSLLSEAINLNSEISILQTNTQSIWEQVSTMSGGGGVFVTLHSDYDTHDYFYFVNSIDTDVNKTDRKSLLRASIIAAENAFNDWGYGQKFTLNQGNTITNCFNDLQQLTFIYNQMDNLIQCFNNTFPAVPNSMEIYYKCDNISNCFNALGYSSKYVVNLFRKAFNQCLKTAENVEIENLILNNCVINSYQSVFRTASTYPGTSFTVTTTILNRGYVGVLNNSFYNMIPYDFHFKCNTFSYVSTFNEFIENSYYHEYFQWSITAPEYQPTYKHNIGLFSKCFQNGNMFEKYEIKIDVKSFKDCFNSLGYINKLTFGNGYDLFSDCFTNLNKVYQNNFHFMKPAYLINCFKNITFYPCSLSTKFTIQGTNYHSLLTYHTVTKLNFNLGNIMISDRNIFQNCTIAQNFNISNYYYGIELSINHNEHPLGMIYDADLELNRNQITLSSYQKNFPKIYNGFPFLNTFIDKTYGFINANVYESTVKGLRSVNLNIPSINLLQLQKLTSKNITNYSALSWAFIKEDYNSNVWSRSGPNAPYEQFIKNGIPLGLDAFINRTPTGSTYRATFAFNQNFSNAATSIYTCYPYLSHLVFWSPGGGNDVSAFNKWCDGNGNWLNALPNLKRLDIIVRDSEISVPIFTLTNSAFANGFNLRTINFWLDVYESQGGNIELKVNADCFKNCFNLREVNVKYLSPQTDTFTTGYNMIASGAFSNCGLTRVDLNWANIGQNAYAGCHPAEIWINSTRLTSQGTDWNKYLTYYGIDTDTNNYIYTIFPYA